MKTNYFKTPAKFRDWLAVNHGKCAELWVGYYKKASGKRSITWPESVDEALCFGWIDGLRKSIDEERYQIRFTTRLSSSHWSAVNIARIKVLIAEKRMEPAGLAAFKNRNRKKIAKASYEQREVKFTAELEKAFRRNKSAWLDFQNRSASYRKQCTWWIVSAKRTETQQKRLAILIDHSQPDKVIPSMRWGIKKKK